MERHELKLLTTKRILRQVLMDYNCAYRYKLARDQTLLYLTVMYVKEYALMLCKIYVLIVCFNT